MQGYFSDPEVVDIFEALLLGDIVDDEDGVRPLVVGACDGAEPLLPSSIPDLELDHFSLDGGRPA
jgi:hypothetical protein